MRTRRGATFIITIAVLAGLVAILAGAAATHRVAAQAAINRMEARRARMVAQVGLTRAIAAFDTAKPGIATQLDDWYTLGSNGADEFTLGNDSFRIQIVDSSARVDLNTATSAQLLKLPLQQDQVDALLDWRTAGRVARPDGAKDDYYHGLDNPYNTKLRRLDTVDELLQVKGFTESTIYEPQNISGSGVVSSTASSDANAVTNPTLSDLVEVDAVSPNVSPAGTPKVNINTANVQQLRARGIPNNTANAIIARRRQRTFTGLGQVLAIPQVNNQVAGTIMSNFMVGTGATSTGKVNLNTATADVLETLPGMTADVAQQIVNMQANGLQSMAQVLTVPGLNKTRIIPIVDSITINSSSYIVRVVGKAGNTTCTIEALLRTDGATKRIVRVSYPPYTDMTARWNWSDPNNQIALGESN